MHSMSWSQACDSTLCMYMYISPEMHMRRDVSMRIFEAKYMYFSFMAYKNVKIRLKALLLKASQFIAWQPPEERI